MALSLKPTAVEDYLAAKRAVTAEIIQKLSRGNVSVQLIPTVEEKSLLERSREADKHMENLSKAMAS